MANFKKLQNAPFNNIFQQCDHTAPEPCLNHTAQCDVWYEGLCPWQDCDDYLTPSDLALACEEHCEGCRHNAYCIDNRKDSLMCEDYQPKD